MDVDVAIMIRQALASGVPLSLLAEKPLLFGPALSVEDAGPQFGGHVTNYGRAVHVDSIKSRIESAYDFSS